MAVSVNKALIIGNVTRDPELRTIPSGQAVANFGVATNRRYKNAQGELVEDVQFHDVVVWGKLAEVVTQIFRKGSKIFVEGRLQTRQWEAQDGSKRQRTEIVLENFVPLTPKSGTADFDSSVSTPSESMPRKTSPAKPSKKTDVAAPPAKDTPGPEGEIDLDEIPF